MRLKTALTIYNYNKLTVRVQFVYGKYTNNVLINGNGIELNLRHGARYSSSMTRDERKSLKWICLGMNKTQAKYEHCHYLLTHISCWKQPLDMYTSKQNITLTTINITAMNSLGGDRISYTL